jgi:hypothetical protein
MMKAALGETLMHTTYAGLGLVIGLALALALAPGSARADAASHTAACAAALSEAQSLQNDYGVWRAEARVLALHRKDPGGLPAKFKPMAEDHTKHGMTLFNRMAATSDNQLTLHKDGACPNDAETAAALLQAARFKNMPDGPSTAPLPEGYCRNSPDMSAPLVPCPKKTAP